VGGKTEHYIYYPFFLDLWEKSKEVRTDEVGDKKVEPERRWTQEKKVEPEQEGGDG